ncbi:MAG: molybdopterin converting factor, small subunit [Haloquadratum walsbyi J07HQW1]|uniref:Molybdopterin converting factor, small subunit n=1 Tax=Haloquadratum walsbyi J07HQW1 TaxID=1238424 RepID=U1N9G8_9EURY|nr:MAG: molybdopterin converting factor, small subunit [Haloquadratum walsbyi J07HQW1]
MISITWRLFADVAEVAGTREESIEISTDASATVGDALNELLRDRPALADRVLIDTETEAEAKAETELATDINLLQNGSAATCDDQLTDGDELALFPPVTGG